MKGSSLLFDQQSDVEYFLGILNSKLISYIAGCLNATVETQIGDIKRVPYIEPSIQNKSLIAQLGNENIIIKQNIYAYKLIESLFKKSPLCTFLSTSLDQKISEFLNYENIELTKILINEALLNIITVEVYELSHDDQKLVESIMGKSIGDLPVLGTARQAYLSEATIEYEIVKQHIENLSIEEFEEQRIREIKEAFTTLYQSNNDLEEFCIRHQLNPINVWYWFREAQVLPAGRAHDITLEFLADAIRTLLMEDEDGIIPLVGLPGEPRLLDRLEQHCQQQGFTGAQFMQLDGLLGRPLPEYLEQHFFRELSDHLNLFMYLPKTPFIWHLSSGEAQGFEAYIIIYKWTRDSLFRLKSQYIGKRVERLEYRQIELQNTETAQAQTEKERIRLQLREIASFVKKLDELIAENYNPILDDGVGKNIAPLQKKGMLKAEVLNAGQLTKYLNADW